MSSRPSALDRAIDEALHVGLGRSRPSAPRRRCRRAARIVVDRLLQPIGAARAEHDRDAFAAPARRAIARPMPEDAPVIAATRAPRIHQGIIQACLWPCDPCISAPARARLDRFRQPSLVPGARGEGAVAAAVARHMRGSAWRSTCRRSRPGGPNVIGVLDGREPGPTLMFCGHLDTVGVDGHVRRRSRRQERDGRLYGRGAQDMKAGVAAMIDAVAGRRRARLHARPPDRRRGHRRGVREHRRRRAGQPLEGRPGGRDRTDRPENRRGAQGIRLARGGDARPCGARQPAARRPRRDHAHGPGAAAARGARSRAAVAAAAPADGNGVAARVDHQRRPGTEQLSGSLPAADGTADAGR